MKHSSIEHTHVFCEICGRRMVKVTYSEPSRFNRQTGEEKKGDSWFQWECPQYDKDDPLGRQHDREEYH